MTDLSTYLLAALVTLLSLTVHEFCHGYAAYRLGDPTAKAAGRLTLNPLSHLDPFGALCMVFFHFGWAKPVPINPRYFRRPKRDFALTALAGPLSNLLMAVLSAFCYLLTLSLFRSTVFESEFLFRLVNTVLEFFYLALLINVGFGLFNLLPVPPLDGSRILTAVLPERLYFRIMRYEHIIYWGLIGWLLVGGWVSRVLLSIPLIANTPLLRTVARVIGLSGLLSDANTALVNAILRLLRLIPFLNV